MKRLNIVFLITIVLLSTTGCKNIIGNRNEISDITFTRAVGIDRGVKNPNNILLTMGIKRVQQGDGGLEKQSEILSNEGLTVFQTVRDFNTFSNKRVFWGHNEFVIVGEDIAKEDLYKYVDFFIRDHELRLNALVYIVKDGTANDTLKKANTPEYFLGERLQNLSNNIGPTSVSSKLTVLDLAKMFQVEHASIYIPNIKLVDKGFYKSIEDRRSIDIEMNGYALLKNNKLVGYVEDEDARGVNWILNKINSGGIVVTASNGSKVSLEIMNANTKIIPKFDKEELSILIEVNMDSNIAEVSEYINIYSSEVMHHLKKKQEESIRKEIYKTINILQKHNTDIIGIGNAVYHKHPIRWQNLKSKWDEIFPKIKFQVIVNSDINRTYNIANPDKVKPGDK